MLLAYRQQRSFFAVGQRLGRRTSSDGPALRRAGTGDGAAALDDRPRPRQGTDDYAGKRKPGWYLWRAIRPRSTAIRTNCGRRGFWPVMRASRYWRTGHQCLAHLVQGTVCRMANRTSSRTRCATRNPERRDAEFEQKMAQVLCVYREVQVLKKAAAKSKKSAKSAAIVSYDEKPGIQVIATTAPDLPPVPNVHATFARDHEYKRHGTLSLLAGIDLLTGTVYALVEIATAAASSSNSSSFSMPPIRPAPRSS